MNDYQVPNLMKSFLKYNALSLLWAIIILILCLMPGKDLPGIDIFQFDKIAHLGVYIILSLLMHYGWRKQSSFSWFHKQTVLKILVLTASYGFMVEVLQGALTVDRQFDLLDAIANATGAVIGSLIGKFILHKLSLHK